MQTFPGIAENSEDWRLKFTTDTGEVHELPVMERFEVGGVTTYLCATASGKAVVTAVPNGTAKILFFD